MNYRSYIYMLHFERKHHFVFEPDVHDARTWIEDPRADMNGADRTKPVWSDGKRKYFMWGMNYLHERMILDGIMIWLIDLSENLAWYELM